MATSKFNRALTRMGLLVDENPVASPDPLELEELEKQLRAEAPPPSLFSSSLDEIFAKHGVISPPFSAEKIFKVLEGLKGFADAAKKEAILAMAALGDWTVESILEDASKKKGAIGAAIETIDQEIKVFDSEAQDGITRENNYLHAAASTIRQEILTLEAKLKEEEAGVQERITTINSELKAKTEQAEKTKLEIGQHESRYNIILKLLQ